MRRDRRERVVVARLARDGHFFVVERRSRLVVGVLVEAVHVIGRAGVLEELVNEMLRMVAHVLVDGFAKWTAADVVLGNESQDQFEDVR